MKTAFFPITWVNRRGVIRAAKRNHAIFVAAIAASERAIKIIHASKLRNPGFKQDLELASASFCGSHLALDLNSGVIAAFSTWDKERGGFLWRTIALTLYEGLNQYMQFVMPTLGRFINNRITDAQLAARHKLCAKRFGLLDSKCTKYLYEIRNNCIAHRDVDPSEFARVRESVNETKLMNYLSEFLVIQGEAEQVFGAAFQQATAQLNTPGAASGGI